MAAELLRLTALALLLSSLRLAAAAAEVVNNLESVPGLENAMYLNVDGYPCVRLLNLSGEIGCSNPGHGKVIAPILRLKSSYDQIPQLSTVLVPVEEMQRFFLRISSDPHFAENIAGVLIESSGPQNMLLGFSPVEKFPQAKFAPYRNLTYEWNPVGSGIMWNSYNFPVFLLSEESTSFVREIASKNEKSSHSYAVNVAEFDLVMQGSVWSSLPPINVMSSKSQKPIILALAAQDSAAFFRDQSLGADSPLSGLIAMLATVDALSNVDGLDELKRQI